MFRVHQNTRLTSLIVAILLMVSSSGFTAVLHSCLMAERSCCDQSMMLHMPLDRGTHSGIPGLKADLSCCAVTLAGGLNTNPIVPGNQHSAPQHLDVLSLLPIAECSCTQDVCSRLTFLASTVSASPPSVEKYVLNATFLI